MKKVWLMFEALGLTVLAILLDLGLQKIGSTGNGPVSYFLLLAELGSTLGIVLLCLLFARQVLFVEPRDLTVSLVLLFFGLLVLASLTIRGYFFWTALIAENDAFHTFYTNLVASQFGLSRFGAAVVCGTGILALIPATALKGKVKGVHSRR